MKGLNPGRMFVSLASNELLDLSIKLCYCVLLTERVQKSGRTVTTGRITGGILQCVTNNLVIISSIKVCIISSSSSSSIQEIVINFVLSVFFSILFMMMNDG